MHLHYTLHHYLSLLPLILAVFPSPVLCSSPQNWRYFPALCYALMPVLTLISTLPAEV